MMEKYGAEVRKYEVVQTTPGTPDDFKVVGEDLTHDEAIETAKSFDNALIRPMN